MDPTISSTVQNVPPYPNRSVNPKTTASRDDPAEQNPKSVEANGSEGEKHHDTADKVELTHARYVVSESNQSASETDVEEIDEVVRRVQEVKEWLESESETTQAHQVHHLDPASLMEIFV